MDAEAAVSHLVTGCDSSSIFEVKKAAPRSHESEGHGERADSQGITENTTA